MIEERRKQDNDKTIVYYRFFESLNELIYKAVNGRSEMPRNLRSSQGTDRSDFYGTNSFNESIKLATEGWPKGLKLIREITKEHSEVFTSYFPKQDYSQQIIHDVTGGIVDIDRAVIGAEPENMWTFAKEENSKITGGQCLQRIIVSCCVSGMVNIKTIFLNGAMITTLVETLELHGFKTEVIVRWPINGSFRSNAKKLYECRIKRFDEALDIDKLAFVVANPSMYRRLIFCLQEQESAEIRDIFAVGDGYGGPVTDNNNFIEENDLFIPALCYTENNSNFSEVLTKFKKILTNRFGAEVLNPLNA